MPPKAGSYLYPFLQDIPLFSGLPPEDSARFFCIGKTHIVKGGRSLVTEGRGGGDLHIIVSGRVEVLKRAPKGGSKVLATLGCGDLFGEMSALDGGAYSATVRAQGDCAVHIIRGRDLHAFLKKNPADAYPILTNFIKILSARLRHMNQQAAKPAK